MKKESKWDWRAKGKDENATYLCFVIMNSLATYESDELKHLLVLDPHLQEIYEVVENRPKNKTKQKPLPYLGTHHRY